MTLLESFRLHASLISGALLLAINLNASADNFEDANQLFKKSQYNQALEKVNEVLAQKPKDRQARFLKGLVLTEQNKTDDAIKIFSALITDYPELPEPYNNLAVLYASQGQYDKARLSLEMAIRTHPSIATAHENLGDIYAKLASQAYDRALKLDHGNAATQTKLAMIQDLFGDDPRKQIRSDVSPSSSIAVVKAPVVASTPVVAAKPAVNVHPVATIDQTKEILKTVQDWAAAWSSRNTRNYLSYYAADFKTPGGAKRTDWEAERQTRISKQKSIHVVISNATVKFTDNDHAVVEFRQSYSASHFKTTGNKTFFMEKNGTKWLIQEERVK
jgi:tetratricopeptide (TPR) repeat protein